MCDNYSNFSNLFEKFRNIDFKTSKYKKTFMEVTGYPHFENVASNLLAFFFDPEEEHGLSDLFFQSLMSLVPGSVKSPTGAVSVQREYCTLSNNRIDLVLSSDSFILGIENKLYSGVQNDLQDYKNTVENIATLEGKTPFCILLSFRDENGVAQSNGFLNVTYAELFDSIKSSLGQYMLDASEAWLIYLKDFMTTIERLQTEEMIVDMKFLDFLKDNESDILEFLEKLNDAKKDFSIKTKSLRSMVDLDSYRNSLNIVDACYNSSMDPYSSFYIDINQDSGKILVIETYINASGWHIGVWNRNGGNAVRDILKDKLTQNGVKFEESNTLIIESYEYDAHLDEVQNGVFRVLDTVKHIKL